MRENPGTARKRSPRDEFGVTWGWERGFAARRSVIVARHCRFKLRCRMSSGVAKQRHEAKVHVLLDMAVKQRRARLVRDYIHCGASKCGDDHCILPDAGSGLAVDLDELEQVPVQ